jgi:hypothetical protein
MMMSISSTVQTSKLSHTQIAAQKGGTRRFLGESMEGGLAYRKEFT